MCVLSLCVNALRYARNKEYLRWYLWDYLDVNNLEEYEKEKLRSTFKLTFALLVEIAVWCMWYDAVFIVVLNVDSSVDL